MDAILDTPNREDVIHTIDDVLARHRDGNLTDLSARRALAAFITSLAPDDFMSDDALSDFDVYLDITLQISKRATSSGDTRTADRAGVIAAIGMGERNAREALRRVET